MILLFVCLQLTSFLFRIHCLSLSFVHSACSVFSYILTYVYFFHFTCFFYSWPTLALAPLTSSYAYTVNEMLWIWEACSIEWKVNQWVAARLFSDRSHRRNKTPKCVSMTHSSIIFCATLLFSSMESICYTFLLISVNNLFFRLSETYCKTKQFILLQGRHIIQDCCIANLHRRGRGGTNLATP